MRDPERFKAAARRFASGVTVVTSSLGGEVHGITASSFCSLSLDPLLVTVAVHEQSRLVTMVESAGCFGISVLASSQRELSRHFAVADRPASAGGFDVAESYVATTGAPIIAGCIAYFDCRLHSIVPGGDHRILVGEVVAAGESDGEPLLYFEGQYHGLELPHVGTPALAAGTSEGDGGSAWAGAPGPGGAAELLTIQQALEPTIAELAAAAATDDDLERLGALLSGAAAATDDPRRFSALSVEFHVALADASHNRRLREVAASLRDEQQAMFESRTDQGRALRVLAAHGHLLEQISRRDPSAARAAMTEHVDDMQRHFVPGPSPVPQLGASSMGRTSRAASVPASIESPK